MILELSKMIFHIEKLLFSTDIYLIQSLVELRVNDLGAESYICHN